MRSSLVYAFAGAATAAQTQMSYTFDPLQHLAGIAPYFEPESPPLDPKPPQGCNVTQVCLRNPDPMRINMLTLGHRLHT